MTPEEMRALYDYNAWANHRALDAAGNLTSEQFTKPLGSSFGSVRDTLAHICGAEWVWMERFQGRSPASLPDVLECTDVDSLRAKWAEQEGRLLAFVGKLTQEDLNPRDGIQDAEVWYLQESAVAIDAARGESWDVSSRTDHNFAAAAWGPADFDGLDALLP